MVSVINNSIIDDLSHEANWRLCSIFIEEWHVEIIHEIDESLAWWWTVGLTSSLVYLGFNNDLKTFRVSVVVEVHGGVKSNFFVKSTEVILDNGGFTGTG